MKIFRIIAYMIIAACANNLFAADDVSYRAKSGDQALLFQLKGLSELSPANFNGGIGYQYYFANHTAFRMGLGINIESDHQDKPDTNSAKDYSKSSVNFSFTPGIRYNFGTSSNILAYMGTEAIYSIAKSTEEGLNFTKAKSVISSNEYGLGFFLGAEWFAFKNVSLSAEYSIRLKYATSSVENTAITGETVKVNLPDKFTAGLGNSSMFFTLSFYFN